MPTPDALRTRLYADKRNAKNHSMKNRRHAQNHPSGLFFPFSRYSLVNGVSSFKDTFRGRDPEDQRSYSIRLYARRSTPDADKRNAKI